MTIKTKLSLGVAFLFLVIVLLGGLGSFYLYQLSGESQKMVQDNYESLEYAQHMRSLLDEGRLSVADWKDWETSLRAQEGNITEPGERELTQRLRNAYTDIRTDTTTASYGKLNRLLNEITELNMQAVIRKSQESAQTARQIRNYMLVIATLSLLVTLSFSVNFPGYIADPIRQLTEGIQEIAHKNYDKRLHFESDDEFSQLAGAFNTMAQRLDEYEHSNLAKLLFEKSRIETIVHNLKDAILGLDEKNRILFVNPAMEQLLGLTEKSLQGAYAPDIALRNDLLRHLLQNEPSVKPLKIFADHKESYFTRETLEVFLPKNAHVNDNGAAATAGQVILLKNITRFQELDLAKTNFIATISHELKTPISSIKMSLNLLENEKIGAVNDEQKQLLTTIQEDSDRLLKITRELLDLSQAETGHLQLVLQPVEPQEIITLAVRAVQFQATQKQIRLDIQLPEDMPRVQADREKTAWVLVNFLSNAIRYSTEQSHIVVQAMQQQSHIRFQVQDFGKGIDPQYQSRIFDRFFQVPDSDPSRSGTGLGLSISRDFITTQGGHIGVNSEPGSGSTFYFDLPVAG